MSPVAFACHWRETEGFGADDPYNVLLFRSSSGKASTCTVHRPTHPNHREASGERANKRAGPVFRCRLYHGAPPPCLLLAVCNSTRLREERSSETSPTRSFRELIIQNAFSPALRSLNHHSTMKTATVATILAATSLATLSPSGVNAHGYIAFPHAQYKDPAKATDYNAIITESINTAFKGKKWNDNPVNNAKTFTAAFKKSGYTSLKQMLDKKVPGCQNSRTDITPVNVKGFKNMEWQNDWEHKGFIDSHHGPCEIWIDNTRVLHNDDCVATYKTYPAVLPVDYSKCKGKCTLTFYWLALHEPNWQIYKHCVPIVNNKALRD